MIQSKKDTLSVIHARSSVRKFSPEPVPREALETLVKAGMAAPTAVNCQPWSFVLVTSREMMNRLADGLPYAQMLRQAGAAVVVCGLVENAYEKRLEWAVIDGTLASENILLAAEALGLGAVWTAVYPYEAQMAHVRGLLGIPATVMPLNVIPVGRPAGRTPPKDKYRPENVRWEKW